MKVIKTYALSEESLEKDIDQFIKEAKKGAFQYDYKYGQEGLKILKAYFRMLEAEFKQNNFAAARICYKKLLFFLLQRDYDCFNYEDILSKFNSEKIVGFYFTCLIKTCSVTELFQEYLEYLKIKVDYYFESVDTALRNELSESDFNRLVLLVKDEAERIKEKDYALYDLLYFLLERAKSKNDRVEYYRLCEKYEEIVGKEQKEEYTGANQQLLMGRKQSEQQYL